MIMQKRIDCTEVHIWIAHTHIAVYIAMFSVDKVLINWTGTYLPE